MSSNTQNNNNSNNNNNNGCNNNNSNNGCKNNNNDSNSNNNAKDKETALGLLTMSKSDIVSLASVITEITNPQLRELLGSQLTNSLNEHYKLSDIAVNKQWYNTFSTPQQQLQQDVEQAQNLSQ
ncbi:MAG: spore coat protein [Clostridiaceae bacterium]|nr:spore coat protein [Clostridiaceae bacterium]